MMALNGGLWLQSMHVYDILKVGLMYKFKVKRKKKIMAWYKKENTTVKLDSCKKHIVMISEQDI